jgi:2'-hydroxyisoflavone reductase
VYGPFDHTDRFYYWLYQVKFQNALLLPDEGKRLFSITYVSDLVQAVLRSLEIEAHNQVYNVISVPQVSIKQIVDSAGKHLHRKPKILNAPAAFLHKNGVDQWTGMPLWIDGDHYTYDGLKLPGDFNLHYTDFEQSVKETIAYYDQLGWPEPQYGMAENQRQELIQKLT